MAQVEIKAGKQDTTEMIQADLDKMMEHESIMFYLAEYALGVMAQRDGAGESPEKAIERTRNKVRNLEAGKLPSRGGGGGSSVSFEEEERQKIVLGRLQDLGYKKQDATKMAKHPEEAFRQELRLKIAAKQGIDQSKVSKKAVDAAFDKNWDTLVNDKAVAAAAKRREATQNDLDLDITEG